MLVRPAFLARGIDRPVRRWWSRAPVPPPRGAAESAIDTRSSPRRRDRASCYWAASMYIASSQEGYAAPLALLRGTASIGAMKTSPRPGDPSCEGRRQSQEPQCPYRGQIPPARPRRTQASARLLANDPSCERDLSAQLDVKITYVSFLVRGSRAQRLCGRRRRGNAIPRTRGRYRRRRHGCAIPPARTVRRAVRGQQRVQCATPLTRTTTWPPTPRSPASACHPSSRGLCRPSVLMLELMCVPSLIPRSLPRLPEPHSCQDSARPGRHCRPHCRRGVPHARPMQPMSIPDQTANRTILVRGPCTALADLGGCHSSYEGRVQVPHGAGVSASTIPPARTSQHQDAVETLRAGAAPRARASRAQPQGLLRRHRAIPPAKASPFGNRRPRSSRRSIPRTRSLLPNWPTKVIGDRAIPHTRTSPGTSSGRPRRGRAIPPARVPLDGWSTR